jgi:hypothetical protein
MMYVCVMKSIKQCYELDLYKTKIVRVIIHFKVVML